MGNSQSGLVYRKLSKELPTTSNMGYNDSYEWKQIGIKAFENEKDREQFICMSTAADHRAPFELADISMLL